MILLWMVAAVAFGALFVRDPRRALWGLAWGLAAMFLLAEFVGVRPGMAVGAIVTALVALSGRRARAAPTLPEDSALDRAWVRLGQVGGFWSRNRIVTLRARYDAVAASTADCDPFSEAGEMRIKLDRYIPELIGNALDDHARAPATRRRAMLAELLAELDRFVTRMEAVDPAGKLRADRQAALRKHLGTRDDG